MKTTIPLSKIGLWLGKVVFPLLVLAALVAPRPAHAQQPPTPPPAETPTSQPAESDAEWLERTTTYFHILYTAGDEAIAENYASFVDTIYDEISTVFSHQTEPPITLRLYPSEESYAQANPLAPRIPGIVAHADFRHREVAVIVPVTGRQTPEGVQNNVRHELTHIIAAEMSKNRLNTGFQEGIAQYVEAYVPELEGKIQLLDQAVTNDTLLSWSDLDKREQVYGQPGISYPQTLSMVSFLIDTYGFGKFRDFLTMTGRTSGYRSALDRAYGVSPTDLEAEWLAWLPSYLEGGYRHNALNSYDLTHARQLVNHGHYAEAQGELEQAIAWLTDEERLQTADEQSQEVLSEAQTLLQRSKDGQQAEQVAAAARAALETGDYVAARQFIEQARTLYAALSDTRQDEILDVYAERVAQGLAAQGRMDEAYNLAQSLQYSEARIAADEAAAEFAVLGDSERYEEALSLHRSLNGKQGMLGTLLVALGVMGVVFSLWGRMFIRDQEVW